MGNLFCCIQVDQSTVAIKERFGKFDDILEPGCRCVPWCLGSQIAGHLTLRLQQLDVKCETKTKVCPFLISALSIFNLKPNFCLKIFPVLVLLQLVDIYVFCECRSFDLPN